MALHDNFENLKFDKRMIDHNLQLGLITRAEYEAHLKSLQDHEANATKIKIEMHEPQQAQVTQEPQVSVEPNGQFSGSWPGSNGNGNSF